MPGPNSAPNGDRSITTNETYACTLHGVNFDKCISAKAKAIAKSNALPKCQNIRKRDFLNSRGVLFSGKTLKKNN